MRNALVAAAAAATLSIVFVIIVCSCGAGVSAQERPCTAPAAVSMLGGTLPVHILENRNVHPADVRYFLHGAKKSLLFLDDGIHIRLVGAKRSWGVKLEFVGADPDVRPEGRERRRAVFSYFHGSESDWRSGLRSYGEVVYRNLWPGIDLVYRAGRHELKYAFRVAPGADPSVIRLRYRGVTGLRRTREGALRVETPEGDFEDAPPLAWQEIHGDRRPVAMAYDVGELRAGSAGFGFTVGEYDPEVPLVLDPAVFVFCGFLGGTHMEWARGVDVDGAGNIYVVGWTLSTTGFPVKIGPDTTHNGGEDCFIVKLSADGKQIIYGGYIGGTSSDWAHAVVVDSSGAAYVCGATNSSESSFPVKNGPTLKYGGKTDVFVAKISPDGTRLVYCGYVGGAKTENASDIVIDGLGAACIVGLTYSDEKTFPVKGGPDPYFNGGNYDGYVAKVASDGKSIVFCGYIGGTGDDWVASVALDSLGRLHVAGATTSTEKSFPVKGGPDLTHNGGQDGFVARIDAAGKGIDVCGYIGGASYDFCAGVAVDATDNVYAVGSVQSDEKSFPVKHGPDLTYNGITDAFLAKLDPTGKTLLYCGYIGGASSDWAYGVGLSAAGQLYVVGNTASDEKTFPATGGPQLKHGGVGDAFIAGVYPGGKALTYCSYIGGTKTDNGYDMAFTPSGMATVVGYTESTSATFPVFRGPQKTNSGLIDAFVAQIAVYQLLVSGAPRPGGTAVLDITASAEVGRSYQVASSLGAGPIKVDKRQIGLSLDALLFLSLSGQAPGVFVNYRGTIKTNGSAQATIAIPAIPALVGITIHSAFVILAPAAPSGIRAISGTESFRIMR